MEPYWEGFLTGVMACLVPSLICLAFLLWDAPTIDDK